MPKSTLTDEQKQDICRRYQEGESTYEIGQTFNLFSTQIVRILKKNNVPLRDNKESNLKKFERGRIATWEGKNLPEEMRLNISKGQIEYWDKASDEDLEKASQRGKEIWEKRTPAEREAVVEAAKAGLEKAKREGSRIEKVVRLQLISLGVKYERHKKSLIPNQNLEIDIYLPEHRAVIEVDGPTHFLPIFGQARLENQIKRDMKKNGLLMGYGYVILRIKMLSGTFTLVDEVNVKNWLKDVLPTVITDRANKLREFDIS